jgi:hypothetical protein
MFERIKERIVMNFLKDWIAAAPSAIQKHLNLTELARIATTAVLSGSGVFGVLEALAKSLPDWVAPGDVGIATGIMILAVETMRRLGHGEPLPKPDK